MHVEPRHETTRHGVNGEGKQEWCSICDATVDQRGAEKTKDVGVNAKGE